MPQQGEENDAILREELGDFGFSDKEIDVYLALLSRGEATTGTISEDADVTQQSVYSITDRLEDRGLVRVNEHASPKTIRAVPPAESMAALTNRIDSITPVLEDRFNDTQPQTPELKIVKSQKTAVKRLRDAVSNAQREVVVAIPKHIYPEIEQELQAALERDVLVILFMQGVDDYQEARNRYAGAADVVRCWSESFLFLFAVDTQSPDCSTSEAALIGDAQLLSGAHNLGDGVAVSEQHLTGSIRGMFFGALWPTGTEVSVTTPDQLPKTYPWFWQAVLQAMVHQQSGTDLWAEVETTDGETLAGPISRIRQALVEPPTNDFTLETSLFLETDVGEVSIGGQNSIIEDYEASSITLQSID
ncbi:Sugar-specific transcriptional regulator TrmB [Halogranum amylolyticum]|uniref:Sugar-specific transcriptional regulator TrmB n=1 Tax=Halogranum amylolyticum TaxID=660520 RepID=A0A1H8VTK2_9EURY|nr:TrmB family transcriptional regulator sugar-binding domain-containing protein [Halogranum amylolyticum]SEP18726.1 Sugar-specific transcriptional regulator TrmB [Halogranum amylolyticum]